MQRIIVAELRRRIFPMALPIIERMATAFTVDSIIDTRKRLFDNEQSAWLQILQSENTVGTCWISILSQFVDLRVNRQ